MPPGHLGLGVVHGCPHCAWGALLRRWAHPVARVVAFAAVSVGLVPGSLTPWGVTPREVGTFPALRSAPCLANWTTAPVGVGLTVVTRFLVAAWARAGGRDMPGYWWLGDLPSVTYGCAALSPSPPWSQWLGDSSSGLGGLRGRRTRELAAGRSHPWPWAFLVSVPGRGVRLCLTGVAPGGPGRGPSIRCHGLHMPFAAVMPQASGLGGQARLARAGPSLTSRPRNH